MKKSLLTILAIMLFGAYANAQVGGVQFNAYMGSQNQMNTMPQTQTQAYSVTAYSADAYGNVQSMQIRVAVISTPSSMYALGGQDEMRVIARYVRNGYAGAAWQEIPTQPRVYQCSPYTNNPLELRFMYKAQVGSNYVYFNL